MHSIRAMASVLAVCIGATVGACNDDLGECDMEAAQELVYGESGLVATKGQALMHDSCGNGAFCHSAVAAGDNRHGAPAGMNFDMLPAPNGWNEVMHDRHEIWSAVRGGDMPPSGVGARTLGDGNWVFDLHRGEHARKLSALSTPEGKAVMRNWLACDAPVVGRTEVPSWVRPPATGDGGVADFEAIYDQILKPKCATAGCHNASAAGGLVMSDACSARAQLLKAGACGTVRLKPGDDGSLLLDKLESAKPACGGRMPPTGALPAAEIKAIKDWVTAGAAAPECD